MDAYRSQYLAIIYFRNTPVYRKIYLKIEDLVEDLWRGMLLHDYNGTIIILKWPITVFSHVGKILGWLTCKTCPWDFIGSSGLTMTMSAVNSGGTNIITWFEIFWYTKNLPFISRPLERKTLHSIDPSFSWHQFINGTATTKGYDVHLLKHNKTIH